MTIQLYPTRLFPNLGLSDNPSPKRLSRYGAPKPQANQIRYKTTYYYSSCPHCLNGTIRLAWDPVINAHSLTCIMCAWTYNQKSELVTYHA